MEGLGMSFCFISLLYVFPAWTPPHYRSRQHLDFMKLKALLYRILGVNQCLVRVHDRLRTPFSLFFRAPKYAAEPLKRMFFSPHFLNLDACILSCFLQRELFFNVTEKLAQRWNVSLYNTAKVRRTTRSQKPSSSFFRLGPKFWCWNLRSAPSPSNSPSTCLHNF